MPFTLLLADKSPTIRRVIELTFAAEDVTVNAAADGREAMASIQASPPDILLADAGMSEPDGYDVAAFVKGTPELARIPVILLTAAFQPVDQARAAAAGCDAVLEKPFELDQLVSKVKELLGRPAQLAPDAPEPVVERACEESGGDPSLDDRLDAIDVALGCDSAAMSGLVETRPGLLEERTETWSPDPETGRMLLVDYFDLIDENIRRPMVAGGIRALRTEAADVAREQAPTTGEPEGATADSEVLGDAAGDAPLSPLRRVFLALLDTSPAAGASEDAERIVRRLTEEPATGEPGGS